jgi:hypothetical protein
MGDKRRHQAVFEWRERHAAGADNQLMRFRIEQGVSLVFANAKFAGHHAGQPAVYRPRTHVQAIAVYGRAIDDARAGCVAQM